MTRTLHMRFRPPCLRTGRALSLSICLLMSAAAAASSPATARAQWTKLDAPSLAGVFLFDVEFKSATLGYAIGSKGSATSIYRTADGGATWEALKGLGLTPSGFTFLDERTGVAGGRSSGCRCKAIARTTDGGATWTLDSVRSADGTIERVQASFGIYSFSFADQATGYAVGTEGTVVKTTDGGASWRRLATGSETDLMADLSFADAAHGLAIAAPITDLYTPNILYRTTDGGATWTRAEGFIPNAAFGEVRFISPEVGFVGGNDGAGAIYKTTDGGATWRKTFAMGDQASSFYGIEFLNEKTGYAVGTAGTIARTADGGETWTLESTGTTEVLQGIAIHDGTVHVVGGNGAILRLAGGASGVEGAETWSGETMRLVHDIEPDAGARNAEASHRTLITRENP